jgi:NAD+ synthase (glutamine-hydrolysing)
MKLIKVGAAVLNQLPLDWSGNRGRIVRALEAAQAAGVELLCLPELCVTGYGCEDTFHAPHTARQAWESLKEILPATRGLAVGIGLPVMFQHGLFNTVALVVDGKLVGLVAKQFLAGDGLHYEPRWFKAWPAGVQQVLETDLGPIPLGDYLFDVGGVKVGFEICEDAWVAKRPGASLALRGADVILNPSASHFAFGKFPVRQRFVTEGSRAFGVGYVYANLLGNEAGRAIYDGGALIAASGQLLAVGPRLSFHDMILTEATLDLDAIRLSQARTASFSPELSDDRNGLVTVPFVWSAAKLTLPVINQAAWETSPSRKEEEFLRAEALGLFDYMRKSRSRGFVVSLSGGADSSAVVCLIALMVELAWAELGEAELKRRLSYWAAAQAAESPAALIRLMLTTAYQATRNSGEVTRHAASTLAEAIGTQHYELDIATLHEGYVQMISQALGRELTWEKDDIALQNIQARVRSPGIWMLANLNGALLISTSNRSEAAVGYATMDGDTSGGLSPLAGIDKAYLRAWLRWLEKEAPQGLHAIPALRAVNEQQPTAELRPAQNQQTDEGDLMPYPVLDAIERSAVLDKLSPWECWLRLQAQFPQNTPAQLAQWTERFFTLWCRNQWKRERYAPSFHLDDANLDPKTWCRFPILSSGYHEELAQLREQAQGA